MSRARNVATLLALGLVPVLVGWQASGEPSKLDDAALKSMLSGLGYEVKEPGTTTYELALTAGGLNIPTRVFLSKSKTKVWLSVALMSKEDVEKQSREQLLKLLQANVDVGPSHFMIDNGMLKLKMAVDNRAITPAILRSELDYLTARVVETKALWSVPAKAGDTRP